MSSKKSSFYPNIQQGIGILLVFIFLSIIFGAFAALINISDNTQLDGISLLLSYGLAAGGTVLIIVRMKKVQHPDIETIHNYSPGLRTIFFTIILTLAVIVAVEPIANLIPIPDSYKSLFEELFKPTIPAFLTAVIVAPVLEELIFRGLILEGFLRNYSPTKAIIIASLLFGIAHLNIWQFIGAFLLGLFIGWVYWKTRSIGLAIGIHIVNNLTSYMAMYLTPKSVSEVTIKDFFPYIQTYYIVVGISILIILSGIYFHKKWLKQNLPNDLKEN
jgi:membrane protease YdiL (CAAX protease family)